VSKKNSRVIFEMLLAIMKLFFNGSKLQNQSVSGVRGYRLEQVYCKIERLLDSNTGFDLSYF
jgi:hypothetical protein